MVTVIVKQSNGEEPQVELSLTEYVEAENAVKAQNKVRDEVQKNMVTEGNNHIAQILVEYAS